MINRFKVRGAWHHRGDVANTAQNAIVDFVPEPANEYDTNAIKITTRVEQEMGIPGDVDLHIGYVPKELTQYVHPLLPLQGHISDLQWNGQRPMIEITFESDTLIPTQQSLKKRNQQGTTNGLEDISEQGEL